MDEQYINEKINDIYQKNLNNFENFQELLNFIYNTIKEEENFDDIKNYLDNKIK